MSTYSGRTKQQINPLTGSTYKTMAFGTTPVALSTTEVADTATELLAGFKAKADAAIAAGQRVYATVDGTVANQRYMRIDG